MAFVDAPVLLDFVSSLAVLGLLVVCFSALAPSLRHGWVGALTLGIFFGLVVGLQMSMPLSPSDGVIIDMRNIPIVLAGAFLGMRGLLACLGIAIAMRVGIGGLGLSAGIIGMLIAGAIGYIWAHMAPRFNTNDATKLVILGLGVNLHMLSAFAVPEDIMRWYFSEAAPTILVLNVLSVPAFGWLLMREQNVATQHAHLSAAAQVDPATRLLTRDAFAQEVSHFDAADGDRRVAGIAAVTLKNAGWLRRTWGDDAVHHALGVLRVRIADRYPDNRPLGMDRQQRVLVPVTTSEMHDLRPVRKMLRDMAADKPLLLDGDVEVPLTVLVESFQVRHPDRPNETVLDIRSASGGRRAPSLRPHKTAATTQSGTDMSLPKGVCRLTFNRLLNETDAQMQRLPRSS